MSICPICGKPAEDDSAICYSCQTDLSELEKAEPESPMPAPEHLGLSSSRKDQSQSITPKPITAVSKRMQWLQQQQTVRDDLRMLKENMDDEIKPANSSSTPSINQPPGSLELVNSGMSSSGENDSKIRSQMLDEIREMEEHGFLIENIERIIRSSSITIARMEMERFLKSIDRIRKLHDKLNTITNPDLEKEVLRIRNIMNDPYRLSDIEEAIDDLLVYAKDASSTKDRAQYETQNELIDDWKGRGYDVSRLEQAKNIGVKRLESEYDQFVDDVQEMKRLQFRLDTLGSVGFEAEVERLRNFMTDTRNITEARRQIDLLEQKRRDRIAEDKPSSEPPSEMPADTSIEKLLTEAQIMFHTEEFGRAVDLYDQVLQIAPHNPEAMFFRKKAIEKMNNQ